MSEQAPEDDRNDGGRAPTPFPTEDQSDDTSRQGPFDWLLGSHDLLDGTTVELSDAPGEASGDVTLSFDATTTQDSQIHSRPAGRLGGFLVDRLLGQGATSLVYLARDELLEREVALKVPRPQAISSEELRRRFLHEGRAAAALKHPHIVTVYEAGAVGRTCYIASELCRGPTLAQWVSSQPLLVPSRTAANWMKSLALAVQHAHDRKVLHRDIKPGNVLLDPAVPGDVTALPPESLIPKLSDFGLARIGPSRSDRDAKTILGTPAYMSPEQAEGRVGDIGPAADVYGLGAVLYVLLTGRPPFGGNSESEILEQVIRAEPTAPSRIYRNASRDLETISLKCLAKDPGRRYPSAKALAEDLDRFLAGKPIQARPPSLRDRAGKWVRRRPALAALVAVSVFAAAVIAGGAVWHVRQMAAQNESLRESLQREERLLRISDGQKQVAQDAQARLSRHVTAANLRLAQQFLNGRELPRAVTLLHAERRNLRSNAEVPFAWRLLWHQCRREPLFPYCGAPDTLSTPAWSPDGKWLAAGCFRGSIVLWRGEDGADVRVLPTRQSVISVAFSPDSQLLASLDEVFALAVWDVLSGKRVDSVQLSGAEAAAIRFSHDGSLVYAATTGPDLFAYDLRAKSLRTLPARHSSGLRCLVEARTRDLLVTGGFDGLRLSTRSGAEALTWRTDGGPVMSVALSPDERLLACGTHHGEIEVHDLDTRTPVTRLDEPYREIHSVAFLDRRHLLSGARDEGLTLWDLETARRVRDVPVALLETSSLHPGKPVVALVNNDRTLWTWNAELPPPAVPVPAHEKEAWSIAFHPTRPLLFTGSDDETARVWDLRTGREQLCLRGHQATVSAVAVSPSGTMLATASLDSTARLWNADGTLRCELTGHRDRVRTIEFSPTEPIVVTGGYEGAVRVWNSSSGAFQRELAVHARRVRATSFSPDGLTLATTCEKGQIVLWNTRDWTPTRELLDAHEVWSAAFSPDGKTLATGNGGGTLKLWDAATGELLRECAGHAGGVRCVAFTPDGRTLATGGEDRTVRLWDAAVGEEQCTLTGPGHKINDVAFSPDGLRLAAASHDGAIHFWDAPRP